MPKLRVITKTPPEPQGEPEQQVAQLRDYLLQLCEELAYVLTHLEADNINDSTFQRIQEMIPKAYTGLPPMDGAASSGGTNAWSRGDHRHPHDDSKADADDLTAHVGDTANPHSVTKAQVGLGNVDNVQQYSASNPPPIPTPAEVGAIPTTEKGSAGGVAELDVNGKVPTSQLPATALLALGETSSTAYRGDRGKTAYDHSQAVSGNPHNVTAEEVGARPDDWMPSASDVGAIPAAEKGAAGGVAELDSNGLVPAEQLPTAASPATAVPLMDGEGAVGTSIRYAREDHEHPENTGKQDLVFLSIVDGKLCVTYEDGE